MLYPPVLPAYLFNLWYERNRHKYFTKLHKRTITRFYTKWIAEFLKLGRSKLSNKAAIYWRQQLKRLQPLLGTIPSKKDMAPI